VNVVAPGVVLTLTKGVAPNRRFIVQWNQVITRNGLALMGHLEGIKLDAAYEYLNWYVSGWMGGFIAKQGYYISVPETAKKFLDANEWGFFYEGKPATADITSPDGKKTNSAGDIRDGGSYEERFAKVGVWNNLMDQAEFLFAKWNEFNAA
jgi:putative spermidine/putrescine transport system substrate-binding protein